MGEFSGKPSDKAIDLTDINKKKKKEERIDEVKSPFDDAAIKMLTAIDRNIKDNKDRTKVRKMLTDLKTELDKMV